MSIPHPFLGKDDLYEFLNIIKKDNKSNIKNSTKKLLLDVIGKEPIHIDKIIGSLNIDRITQTKLFCQYLDFQLFYLYV